MTRNELFCLYALLLRSPLFLFLTFVSCHAGIFSSFSILSQLPPSHLLFSMLEASENYVPNCNGQMNLFLLQRCDLRDACANLFLIDSSASAIQAYFWSCFPQYCGRFHRGNLLVFYKVVLLASEFPAIHERFFMVSLNSSSFGSMKKIPRNCLALSSFGFSTAHFCFAFRFTASDICSHMHCQVLKLFVSIVSLLPDHVHPSGGLSFNRINLVKPVHASDNSPCPSTFQ